MISHCETPIGLASSWRQLLSIAIHTVSKISYVDGGPYEQDADDFSSGVWHSELFWSRCMKHGTTGCEKEGS